MAKLPCPPQSRIYTLKDTGETMSYDQVREYLMSNPELWSGKAEVKGGPLSSVEATAKALEGVDELKSERGFSFVGNKKLKGEKHKGLNFNELIDRLATDFFGTYGVAKSKSTIEREIDALERILMRPDNFKYEPEKAKPFKEELELLEGYRDKGIKNVRDMLLSSAYHAAKKDGSNPELVKAVEDLLGEKAEGKETAAPNTPEGIAARIRNKKQRGVLSTIDFGTSIAIYNGALEFMAAQVEKGTKLGEAIANTIKWIDERMKGEKWNKEAFEKAFKGSPEVKPVTEVPIGKPIKKTETDLLVRARPNDILNNLNRYSLKELVTLLTQHDREGEYWQYLDAEEFPNKSEALAEARKDVARIFGDFDLFELQQRQNWMDLTQTEEAVSPFAVSEASKKKIGKAKAKELTRQEVELISEEKRMGAKIVPGLKFENIEGQKFEVVDVNRNTGDVTFKNVSDYEGYWRGTNTTNPMKNNYFDYLFYQVSEPLSPEQKLKQAFDEWKAENNKLGITINWDKLIESDKRFIKALYEYIKEKLSDGAYSFEEFAKEYGKKIVNFEEQKSKWQALYDRAVKGIPVSEGRAIKAAVEKTAGIKRSTKTEVQRIIDRAFAIGMGMGTKEGFVKGATAGMKAGAVEGRTQAVDMLRNALANLSGELTPKQVSAIVERMGRLKTFSEAAKQSFIDYADKVIEDANYIAKEKKATEIKKAVKQISNRTNVAANDQTLYKSFASLSISHLTPSDLDKYVEWGTKIKNRALKPGDRVQLASFIEQAQQRQNAIVQERSEKMKEGRMRNLRAEFDEMEAAGTLPKGITTFDEYVAFKKPKPKGETLEDKIASVNERLAEIPEGENAMIDRLRNVDLSVLNKEDLTLIDNSLYNYIDTGKLYGIGDPLVKAEYLGKVKAAVDAGLRTRRQVDRKDAEILGMSNLFTTLGETKDVAAKLRGLLIQPWLSAATKANSKYIEIETALMAKADKLKIKQPNWNRIDLFGFLNEGEGNPELFEKLKEQKLSDLETLRERVAKNIKDKEYSATAKAQEYAYNALKEAAESLGFNENSTLESVREKLSENELAFYNETRKYLDQYSPKALENMELYGNKEVGITKNYWPRTTNKINERPTGIDAFDLYGSEYVGKNMFGREKGRSRLLGKAGYYTPVGQENYFNGLKETMLIAEAAHEYHGMQALYNTPEKGFGQLIKGKGAGDIKQLMIDWIMDTKNVGRYQGGVSKISEDILNAIQKGFTRSLINNPTQVVKQPTALAYTFAEAPEPTFRAVGLIAQAMMEGKDSPLAKAINGLFETTTLGQRLYHPEMIEVKEKYTIDKPEVLRFIQQILKGFNARIGGNLLVPVDAVVSQVATLAGYIQQAEKSGKEFNIFNEQAKGYDMVAAAAADQMQAKTNNENAAIYFSKRQLNNRALYYLGNFQANAVRNLYISIRKIVSGRTKQEVQEGLQGVAGYVLSASLFTGAGMLTSYATAVTAFALYQGIMNALGDTEDDEEEKKRILKWLDSKQLLSLKRRASGEVVSMLTGAYGILARAALEATLAGLEQAYYRKTEEEEKPSDRIFFTPEVSGYAGVVADNIVSPLELTAKATDPQEEAMAQTGLLAAKALGQSAMGFYVQNLLNAKKFKEKAAKATKEEQTKTLEQKAFPKKKKLAEAKKEWTKSVEQGDAGKAKAAFNEIAKLSDDTPYITAIELRESFYKDKVRPSAISEGDEFVWLDYIFEGRNGDYMIGEAKLKDLVPPSERQKYIEEYKRELDKVKKMTSVMNKTIKVKNADGVFVNWAAPFDWVKQVQDKVGKK